MIVSIFRGSWLRRLFVLFRFFKVCIHFQYAPTLLLPGWRVLLFSVALPFSLPLTFPSLSIHHVIEHLLENVVCLYKHVCIDRIFCIITKAKIHIHFVLPVPFLSFSISTLALVSMYLYISLSVSCSLVCTDKTEHFLVCVFCIYKKKNLFDRRDTLYDYTMFSTQ